MEPTLLYDILLTEEQRAAFTYDGTLREEMIAWVQTTDAPLIMVFGSVDPWYYERIPLTGNESIRVYTLSGGSHMSMFRALPEEERDEAYALLDGWLGVSPEA